MISSKYISSKCVLENMSSSAIIAFAVYARVGCFQLLLSIILRPIETRIYHNLVFPNSYTNSISTAYCSKLDNYNHSEHYIIIHNKSWRRYLHPKVYANTSWFFHQKSTIIPFSVKKYTHNYNFKLLKIIIRNFKVQKTLIRLCTFRGIWKNS